MMEEVKKKDRKEEGTKRSETSHPSVQSERRRRRSAVTKRRMKVRGGA